MDYNAAKKWLKDRLTGERYEHSIGSEETARELAARFNVDIDKAGLAALLHDSAKNISNDDLLKIIEEHNIPVSEMEKNSIKTLHAPVGAFLVQKELGINDPEILDSIRYHTVGKIGMSNLEKIIFLADKIEPYTRDQSFREEILAVLDKTNNLDEAILLCYGATIKSLVDRKLTINTQTIDVWNDLILKLCKGVFENGKNNCKNS